MVPTKQRLVPVLYILTTIVSIIIAIVSTVMIINSDTNTVKDFQIIALSNALIILVLLPLPNAIFRLTKYEMPRLLHIYFILFIWASLIVGETIGIYRSVGFYDIIIHVIGGYLIALFGIYLINTLKKDNTPFFTALFVFSFTQASAVIWELFEYGVDSMFGSNMQSYFDDINQVMFLGQAALKDTMLDLVFNIIGMTICLLTYKMYRRPLVFKKKV